VPELPNVVHDVLEQPGAPRFVFTGSSARKLRGGGVDLPAGRALLRTLHPFMAAELAEFRADEALRFGLLPLVVAAGGTEDKLRGYAALFFALAAVGPVKYFYAGNVEIVIYPASYRILVFSAGAFPGHGVAFIAGGVVFRAQQRHP